MPRQEESDILHRAMYNLPPPPPPGAAHPAPRGEEAEKAAAEARAEAEARAAAGGGVAMDQTRMQSVHLMQPQVGRGLGA